MTNFWIWALPLPKINQVLKKMEFLKLEEKGCSQFQLLKTSSNSRDKLENVENYAINYSVSSFIHSAKAIVQRLLFCTGPKIVFFFFLTLGHFIGKMADSY